METCILIMATTYSFPHDPLINLSKKAALKARDMAEELFKIGDFDMAIKQVTVAKEFDSELQSVVDHFITAYKVHKAVSEKKDLYHVLGLPQISDSEIVKKQYKELARFVHPDKNASLAAEGAFKHIKAAWDVLSIPSKKRAYDAKIQPPISQKKKRAAPSASSENNQKKTRAAAAGIDLTGFKKLFTMTRIPVEGQKYGKLNVKLCI